MTGSRRINATRFHPKVAGTLRVPSANSRVFKGDGSINCDRVLSVEPGFWFCRAWLSFRHGFRLEYATNSSFYEIGFYFQDSFCSENSTMVTAFGRDIFLPPLVGLRVVD